MKKPRFTVFYVLDVSDMSVRIVRIKTGATYDEEKTFQWAAFYAVDELDAYRQFANWIGERQNYTLKEQYNG